MRGTRIAFWDTSAIVPLCTVQGVTSLSARYSRQFPKKVVWWVTRVEAISALARECREGSISVEERNRAELRLKVLQSTWNEVLPADPVRVLAEKLLDAYPLRASDALQLAAALRWCKERSRRRAFVCFDDRLGEFAGKAGFSVVGVN